MLRCDAIIIHNADHPFLKMEFARIDGEVSWLDGLKIIDSLVMARKNIQSIAWMRYVIVCLSVMRVVTSWGFKRCRYWLRSIWR